MGFVAKEIQEKRKKNIYFLNFWARFAGKKMKNMINGKNTCSRFFMFFPKKEKKNNLILSSLF